MRGLAAGAALCVFCGCRSPLLLDADGDGSVQAVDCQGTNSDVHPGAVETRNGIDDDCNGIIDDNAVDATVWYVDKDADGAAGTPTAPSCTAPEGAVQTAIDCDDNDPNVNPDATEVCNGIDDN